MGKIYKSYTTDGVVSLNLLMDWLDGFEVVSTPKCMEHTLLWCSVPKAKLPDDTLSSSRVIYLLHTGNLQNKELPPVGSYALLILNEDEPFNLTEYKLSQEFRDRLVVVRRHEGSAAFSVVQTEIQSLFFRAYQWIQSCASVLARNGSIQELLDATEPLCGNWIDVNNATYQLVAYTRNIDPPDELSRSLVELGCHSSENIAIAKESGAFKDWRGQDDINFFEADDVVPYDYVTYIMRLEGNYFGHVVMVCNNWSLTPGAVDLFRTFAELCQTSLELKSRNPEYGMSPHQGFIETLLEGTPLEKTYLESQLEAIGLGGNHLWRLAAISYQESDFSEQPMFLLSVVRDTFPHAKAILHDGNILVLFYGGDPTDQTPTSIKEQHESLGNFCKMYSCKAYTSNVTGNITDLNLLYKQTEIARRYRTCIESEWKPLADKKDMNIYLFEDAFNFYCCDFGHKDEALIAFSLSCTLLDTIMSSSQDRDVPDIKLLYYYLCNERKATPTADQLHMHRNNVLYRISSIEKRYEFNLDYFDTRQYLLNCYRFKIMNSVRFREMLE